MPKKDRVEIARAALLSCTPEERAKLFAELGHGLADEMKALARVSPGAAVGAMVGGVLGALMYGPMKGPITIPGCTTCGGKGLIEDRFCGCETGKDKWLESIKVKK